MTFNSGEYRKAYQEVVELIQSREKQEVLA